MLNRRQLTNKCCTILCSPSNKSIILYDRERDKTLYNFLTFVFNNISYSGCIPYCTWSWPLDHPLYTITLTQTLVTQQFTTFVQRVQSARHQRPPAARGRTDHITWRDTSWWQTCRSVPRTRQLRTAGWTWSPCISVPHYYT